MPLKVHVHDTFASTPLGINTVNLATTKISCLSRICCRTEEIASKV